MIKSSFVIYLTLSIIGHLSIVFGLSIQNNRVEKVNKVEWFLGNIEDEGGRYFSESGEYPQDRSNDLFHFLVSMNAIVADLQAENALLKSKQEGLENSVVKLTKSINDIRNDWGALQLRWNKTQQNPALLLSVKDFVSNPEAILWENGRRLAVYKFKTSMYEGGCDNIIYQGLDYVDTFGKCIRVFKDRRCQGLSLALYPKDGVVRKVPVSGFPLIGSVGPCLPNEFQFNNSIQQFEKNAADLREYIPDKVVFYSHSMKATYSSASANQTSYIRGPLERVEHINSEVYLDNVVRIQNSTTHCLEDSYYFKSLEKKTGDVFGYAIPVLIGGPEDETFNIFPQTRSGRDEWLEVLSPISAFLRQDGSTHVSVRLSFLYESDFTRRPHAFYYYIGFWKLGGGAGDFGQEKIIYGRIQN